MFKLVCFIFFFTMMPRVYGQACKVYGISDSPQKLDCSFRKLQVKLSCQKGEYYLNDVKVDEAFHMEVESGPVPLVFMAPKTQLSVLIHSRSNISAELEEGNRLLRGKCRP